MPPTVLLNEPSEPIAANENSTFTEFVEIIAKNNKIMMETRAQLKALQSWVKEMHGQ